MDKPHKHKDLIIAWANGAEIQSKYSGVWLDQKCPSWNSEVVEHRIKPQGTKLKLVPFTWEDRDDIRGKWIKVIEGEFENDICLIRLSQNNVLYINGLPSDYILQKYVFLDGSPCGKYVEQDD